MSRHTVERFLHSMNRDSERAEVFMRDPSLVLSDVAGLTPNEHRMLGSKDLLGLYRYGIHPLLLAQASRFFGMTQDQFHNALQPAIGERQS